MLPRRITEFEDGLKLRLLSSWRFAMRCYLRRRLGRFKSFRTCDRADRIWGEGESVVSLCFSEMSVHIHSPSCSSREICSLSPPLSPLCCSTLSCASQRSNRIPDLHAFLHLTFSLDAQRSSKTAGLNFSFDNCFLGAVAGCCWKTAWWTMTRPKSARASSSLVLLP